MPNCSCGARPFALKAMLNRASYEDRPALDLTLKQLN
jgi:hypothetical protein